MRQWLPQGRDVDVPDLYRGASWAPEGRPGIAVSMVVGVDGGVTVDGRSGELGGEGDRAAFLALRQAADAILVGAGTVRTEDYGPPSRHPEAAERRVAAGRAPVPTLVIVTGTLDLDPRARVFGDRDRLPVVLTTATAPAAAEHRLREVGVDVVRLGEERIDLAAARQWLATRGWRQVLCEGGPTLNTALFDAGLVDELFLTLAPTVTRSPEHLLAGAAAGVPVQLELRWLVEGGDGDLLLRYGVRRDAVD